MDVAFHLYEQEGLTSRLQPVTRGGRVGYRFDPSLLGADWHARWAQQAGRRRAVTPSLELLGRRPSKRSPMMSKLARLGRGELVMDGVGGDTYDPTTQYPFAGTLSDLLRHPERTDTRELLAQPLANRVVVAITSARFAHLVAELARSGIRRFRHSLSQCHW